MSIELELLNATRFKQDADAFGDRQDYLAAIVKAVDKLSADDFDELSDEASEWFNKSVKALNTKRPLPDFDPTEGNDEDPELSARRRKAANAKAEAAPEAEAEEVGCDDAPPETQAAKPPKKAPAAITKPKIVNGELVKDRFGVVLGTKTAAAVALYNTESGATVKEIDEKIGGRHMNILKKLTEFGHKVLKLEGGRVKLIHKDDAG